MGKITALLSALILSLPSVSEGQVIQDSFTLLNGPVEQALNRQIRPSLTIPDEAKGQLKDFVFPAYEYKFRARQLIAPVVLVGVGVAGLTIKPVKNLNRNISSHYKGNSRSGFDDYVQYVPFAAPYLLKLCGVRSRHTYGEYTILLATSYLAMGIMVNTLKYTVKERRPDGRSRNSFPSGHTATAFMGAELLRSEFWDTSPWIGVCGYLVAATVGYMRIWHNRHWTTDVLAGAGIGILSVRIAYWTFPPLQRLFFGKRKKENGGYISAAPYYDGSRFGTALSISF